MWTKIKNWFLKYLDLFLVALVGGLAFFLGRAVKWGGPENKGSLRNFTDVDEFKSWYASRFLKYWLMLNGDCDHRAELIQKTALKDGFILSLALIRDGQYYGVGVSDVVGGHCGVLALLQNGQFVYLEHNTGTFTFVVNRD